jgi:signal transduction histidine kinase
LAELPTVKGDDEHLLRLFENLISNAIKYRDPDRALHVEVGARRQAGSWLFWVRDNGLGIEAKFLKQIFGLGPNSRLHGKIPGTGYGLYICEMIVTGHGGRIWAESKELGQGSTFYFTLPVLRAEA